MTTRPINLICHVAFVSGVIWMQSWVCAIAYPVARHKVYHGTFLQARTPNMGDYM